jgi:hypothetical protein
MYSKNYEDIKNNFDSVDEANNEEVIEIKKKWNL